MFTDTLYSLYLILEEYFEYCVEHHITP